VARGGDMGASESASVRSKENKPAVQQSLPAPAVRKLSYNDQRELQQLPALIEQAESKQQLLEAQIAEPDFYQGEHQAVQQVLRELGELQAGLESLYERWAELES
jgi:ATP-binding cassette subfamily F protein uup